MIEIYKQENNGEVGVLTDCLDAEKFMEELSEAVVRYIRQTAEFEKQEEREQVRDLDFMLPNAFKIMLKLKGYKNEGLSERRLLFAGDRMPAETEDPVVSVPWDEGI